MHQITPIIYEINGEFAGYVAELPGATGQGRTIDDVLDELRLAVAELVDEYQSRNLPVPWRKIVISEPLSISA